jgi:hypothetical protein
MERGAARKDRTTRVSLSANKSLINMTPLEAPEIVIRLSFQSYKMHWTDRRPEGI